MSPSLMLMMSPGTRITASCSDHLPSRRTYKARIRHWSYVRSFDGVPDFKSYWILKHLNERFTNSRSDQITYLRLWSKSGHKWSCSISCVVFLDKTNCGVDDEKCQDTDKILPVWGLSLHTCVTIQISCLWVTVHVKPSCLYCIPHLWTNCTHLLNI